MWVGKMRENIQKQNIFWISAYLLLFCRITKGQESVEIDDDIPMKLPCGISIPVGNTQPPKVNPALGEHPWIALLAYKSSADTDKIPYKCYGSLISEKFVLTAAHCLQGQQLQYVRLGEYNLDTDVDCESSRVGPYCFPKSVDMGVEKVIVHPQYNKRFSYSDDIALIRLAMNVDFTLVFNYGFINTICLVGRRGFNPSKLLEDRRAIVVGWGFNSASFSNLPKRAEVFLVDEDTCKLTYKDYDPKSQICMTPEKENGTCIGGGGSSLILDINGFTFEVMGVLSYGVSPCGVKNIPTVFTNVGFYDKWINEHMKS